MYRYVRVLTHMFFLLMFICYYRILVCLKVLKLLKYVKLKSDLKIKRKPVFGLANTRPLTHDPAIPLFDPLSHNRHLLQPFHRFLDLTFNSRHSIQPAPPPAPLKVSKPPPPPKNPIWAKFPLQETATIAKDIHRQKHLTRTISCMPYI